MKWSSIIIPGVDSRTDQLIKLAVVAFIRHYCIVVTGMDYLPDPSVCTSKHLWICTWVLVIKLPELDLDYFEGVQAECKKYLSHMMTSR